VLFFQLHPNLQEHNRFAFLNSSLIPKRKRVFVFKIKLMFLIRGLHRFL
jgi:hypothetical protein